MKLRSPSYLVLGMLHLGARSGYAIKKATDISTRVFFPTSLAQVYPELGRLQRDGLVTRRDDPHGGRTRSAYEATDRGKAVLVAWLRSERIAPAQIRDEGLLRLFLADALPHEEQIELIRRLRDRSLVAQRWMQAEVLPAADAVARTGARHPRTVAQLGSDTYGFLADWLERLASELEAEGDRT
ncbi:MAG: PadR family transcriptional regulator [Actinomycetota bacterium]|nr:PadR family transcriptional regulator [Actinomycetota bacterium]